jgi:hypothetical protein
MRSSSISIRSMKVLAAVATTVMAAAFLSACSGGFMDEEPPESKYVESEVFVPMEAEVADTVAALPDFPGFESRSWNEMPCSHNGADSSEYVNIEIRYGFDDADSLTPTVRETYVDTLRQRWSDLGYDIHRDQPTPDGEHYALEARREDGINLWYRVMGGVSLLVQSGCVPRSDPGEIEYISPAGGITPGGEFDTVNITGFKGMPEAPSEEPASSSPAGMVPWAREPDPIEASGNLYEDQP